MGTRERERERGEHSFLFLFLFLFFSQAEKFFNYFLQYFHVNNNLFVE